MMNKIRNLFKKKKKSDSDKTGEFDLPDFESEDVEISEIDEEDQHLASEEYEEEMADEAPLEAPLEVPHDAVTTQVEQTGPIQVATSATINAEDRTGDIIVDNEQYEPEDNDEEALDLVNGKVPFKDRVVDAIENLKANLQRISINKPKKMSLGKKTEKTDPNTKFINRIKTHPIFQKVKERIEEGEFSKKISNEVQKINWRSLHHDFFKPEFRQKYQNIFVITALVLATYTGGKITGLLLKGTKDYKTLNKNVSIDINRSEELTSNKITQLKNAKLFKTQILKDEGLDNKKPVIKTDIICKTATRKSTLPITLVNTIVLQDSVKSIASVQLRSSNELLEFRQGDKINSMAQVDKIERLRLIVKNLQDGSCESIENEKMNSSMNPIAVMSPKQSSDFKKLQSKIAGIENEGNSFTIDKNLINEKMANISDILTQARGIQITNPDGTLSFKIVDIQPGGIFSYLGIENNDIITQINGQPISDLNAVMGLFGKITTLDKLNLTVNRRGTEMPLDYKFR